jgi:hypothetical protein
MPVICLLRQPPPSTTARQASVPEAKSRWQNTFDPSETVPFSPSVGQGVPETGAPAGRGDVVVVAGVVAGVVDGVVR